MANTAACAHHLNIAGGSAPFISQTVLVRNGASAHIGNNLHVGMGVWGKAGLRRNQVIIPYADRTPAHAGWIIIATE